MSTPQPLNKTLITLLLLTLAWGTAPALADQKDPRLAELFKQLHAARDSRTAAPIEGAIWQLWLHHDNPNYQALMDTGIRQLNDEDLQGALATYTQLVKLAPDYAEAWNKRATVYYLLGNFVASEQDIKKTLELEPFHFGALSGRGMVKLGQHDLIGARSAFNATLEVYPAIIGVKLNLEQIDELLRKKSI